MKKSWNEFKPSLGITLSTPRLMLAPAFIFLLGATIFVTLFSLARIDYLESEQTARVAIYLDRLTNVVSGLGENHNDLAQQFLETLSGARLFECISVQFKDSTRNLYWPFAGCDKLAKMSSRDPFAFSPADAPETGATVKVYIDQSAPLDTYAQEFTMVILAVVVTALLMIFAIIFWVRTAIRRPIKNMLDDIQSTIVQQKLSYSRIITGPSELDTLAQRYKSILNRMRELMRKEKFEEALKNKTLNGLILTDENQIIIEFNPAAEKIFGYRKKDVLGKMICETVLPQQHRKACEDTWICYKNKEKGTALGNGVFEMEAMNSRGEIIDLEMCIEAISNEGEQFFAAYINDVSEAKQREKELIRARDDYEQANKAKNSFLAMMSHEVRTPLNGVLGLIQLLLEEEDLSARQREYLHIAKSSGKHLLHVLNDILDLTQVESGQLELEETVFSVRSMCQEIVVLAGPEIREKNLFIDLEIDKNLPERIYGDESRLRQVILNFVSNAAKFTDQGHIIIRAQVINNDQPDMVELLFEVEDTGVGLSSQEQSIIFDAFRQLKTGYSRKHEGSGLGLTISKRLIETMDGSIGVDSTPGKGSRFWCVLPITTVTIEPVLVEKNNEYANQKKMLDGRVLLVEDSASNAMVASLILTNAGLTVDVARDGFEAIQSVQSLPYDLVLMDISMPGMDGLDTTRRILDLISEGDGSFPNKDELPIIAMTAHAMRGDKDRFLSAGMVDYISKPISKEVILSVISEWLIRTKT